MRFKFISIILVIAFLFSLLGSDLIRAQGPGAPSEEVRASIAVLDFQCSDEIGGGECLDLSAELRNQLSKTGRHRIMGREDMAGILNEAAISAPVCPDEACALNMGRYLGVEKIIYGSISRVQELFFLKINVVNSRYRRTENIIFRAFPGPVRELSPVLAAMAAEISRTPVISIPIEIPAAQTQEEQEPGRKTFWRKKSWVGIILAGLILGGAVTAIAITQTGEEEKGSGTVVYSW